MIPQLPAECLPLLAAHASDAPAAEVPQLWLRLLKVLILEESASTTQIQTWSNLIELPLWRDPALIANCPRQQLVEGLQGITNATRRASQVQHLARWWQRQGWSAQKIIVAAHTREVNRWRQEWCQLPGLGMPTVDRLLLYAVGAPVFPLTRTVVRVFMRHGWMQQDATEAEEILWSDSADSQHIRQVHQGLTAIGRLYCTANPRCDICPLRPWLSSPISE